MKTQVPLIAFLILFVPLVRAQQTRFPIKPGSVWRINFEFSSSCSDDVFIHRNGDEEYKYFIDGDTLVGARTYFKLYKTGILYLDSPFAITHKYMGAIRDSADRIYYLAKEKDLEKLLYDFTVDIGDLIYVEGTGNSYPVDRITTLENGRKQYGFNILSVNCGSANTIIEGIGWLGGLLEGNSCSGHPGVRGSYLVCYSEDNQIIYQNDHPRCGDPVRCEDIVVSTNDMFKPIHPVVAVLPGGSLNIRLPDGQVGIYEIEIFNVWGKITYHKKSELSTYIDFSMLGSGIYLLRLSNKEKCYTTKFIIK